LRKKVADAMVHFIYMFLRDEIGQISGTLVHDFTKNREAFDS
jgi:hypothetical protein